MTESILPTVLLSAWFWMLWPISFLASTCDDGIGVVAVVRGGVVVLVWAQAGAARAKATALVSASFLNITKFLRMSDCAPESRGRPTSERAGGNRCSITLQSSQPAGWPRRLPAARDRNNAVLSEPAGEDCCPVAFAASRPRCPCPPDPRP